MDRNVAFSEAGTLTDLLQRYSYAQPEFGLVSLSAFAGIGLLLTAIGVFSVLLQITPKGNRGGSNQHPPAAARLRELIEVGNDRAGEVVGIYACSLLLGTLRSEGKLPDFIPMRDPRDLFDQLASLL